VVFKSFRSVDLGRPLLDEGPYVATWSELINTMSSVVKFEEAVAHSDLRLSNRVPDTPLLIGVTNPQHYIPLTLY